MPFDDVRKREAIADSRRIRIRTAGICVVAALALVAGYLAFDHMQSQKGFKDLYERQEKLIATGRAKKVSTSLRSAPFLPR